MPTSQPMIDTSEQHARSLDAADPLASFRERFHIPPNPSDPAEPSVYMCGNSLGCMPRGVTDKVGEFLEDWARYGVEGHFDARDPWYPCHESLREPYASLLGAKPEEVVAMNSLTVNLHLLMTTFYRPEGKRNRILIDGPCFPSDVYAVKSQIRSRGFDPEEALIWASPREGEGHLREEDIVGLIEEQGDSIALVLLAGVNYYSGQFYDVKRIVDATHAAGAVAGVDLAHAAGNVPVKLHDWGADFAVWCTYKYLNSGAGAIAGAFVHERHLQRADFAGMPRCEGWWGNDPGERFKMTPEFEPVRRADAWSLSNPPILSLLPVKVSLDLFMEAGYANLRAKSEKLTGYLESMIESVNDGSITIITPREPSRRGCQLSLLTGEHGRELHTALSEAGVMCDFREPNVIRIAPTPLYNTFHDCWRFAEILGKAIR
ncbi:MAG: kynureninase [Phycisphaerales bacterium]